MNLFFKIILCVSFSIIFKNVAAQDFNLLYDQLDDVLFNGKTEEINEHIKNLNLKNNDLSETKKAMVNYKIGTYFEKKVRIVDEAIVYYEKSLTHEPNYFVPHLAVGYLYLKEANDLRENYNQEKDIKQKQVYLTNYKVQLVKALPHLEKAYACDPNEPLLNIINTIYTTLKNPAGFSTLNQRIKILNQKCIEILMGY
jgi:tetratricopeptide (TPR) repeat protein